MNEFVPRGYLPLKEALEYFGRRRETAKLSDIGREALDHELENTVKASSKQEFQQLVFKETVSAKHFIGGELISLESSIWGRAEAEYIFASGWATIHGGNEYFPAEVRGPVLIEQSSIDALFDDDSDGPSQSPEAISDGALTDEPSPAPDSKDGTPAPPRKKRGGGPKHGPYYSPLKTHLKWRKKNKDDLDTASLTELRKDARNRLTIDNVTGIPKSRSALDDAIKAVLSELGVNR